MVRKETNKFFNGCVDFLIYDIWLIVVTCHVERRNLHISFPCSSKNLSDLELDDFSSLLTESTNGGIEAFAKYL